MTTEAYMVKTPTVAIAGMDVQQVTYRGEPVVTFSMVDHVHQRADGTAGRNFRENRERFVEGQDFFELTADEIRRQSLDEVFAARTPKGIILTRRGYLKLTKPMNDDRAWQVQGEMVDRYFAGPGILALPDFSDPVLAARAWADEREARQRAERTKAEIGTRREATAMATASIAVRKATALEMELDRSMSYASIKRMEMLYHGQSFNWRLLKQTAAEMGVASIDIFDANYGTVKAYHASVWREAYALEIPDARSAAA